MAARELDKVLEMTILAMRDCETAAGEELARLCPQ